ncbi:hypothetical protein L1281_000165 [Neisseria sp. HSC-16F19]|nr:hypothetical protein [Neisseria sp. HSC-16F19]MCP2039600.1 hypothetical protein [Neisseria sp. HSC-16F19]
MQCRRWCVIAAGSVLLAACTTSAPPVCRADDTPSVPPFTLLHECAAQAQPQVLWLHVHADETTALDAARNHIRTTGRGCVLVLDHPHGRELHWPLGGHTLHIDPNRIFTPAGRGRVLAAQACSVPQAEAVVAQAVEPLLQQYLQQRCLLVAVHNNATGGFGVDSYAEGGHLAADAAAVALPQPQAADDFFYVTHRRAFDFFRSRGHNVVLQHPQVRDDGSLSVWAAQAGIEYINVEAQHGHLQQQQAMLQAVQAYIDAFVRE